jgi:hypothetical protein
MRRFLVALLFACVLSVAAHAHHSRGHQNTRPWRQGSTIDCAKLDQSIENEIDLWILDMIMEEEEYAGACEEGDESFCGFLPLEIPTKEDLWTGDRWRLDTPLREYLLLFDQVCRRV